METDVHDLPIRHSFSYTSCKEHIIASEDMDKKRKTAVLT